MSLFGERGKRNLQTIAERGFEEGQDTLIGFVNFNDNRYQKIVNTRNELPEKYNLYDDNVKRFVGVYDKEKDLWSFVLRGQEIPTDQGHLLILGNDKEIGRRIIEDVLKEARDIGSLIIADHPLAESFLLNVYNRLFNKQDNRYSLGEENLRKYKDKIDGVEAGNSNIPKLTERTEKLADELCLPKFYESDSHILKTNFSSYMIFPKLDFENWEKLRKGIIENANNNGTIYCAGRNRKFENFYHGASVFYNVARQKIGWVKMPEIEIE